MTKYTTPIRVAFSGGRTSGLMLHRLLQEYDQDDLVVTFANTGREMEQTLQFVHEIETRWAVPIHWVEYSSTQGAVVEHRGKRAVIGCHGFREVTFATASRNGEPFEDVIVTKARFREAAKQAAPILPNVTDRWCSGELKHRTMDRFMATVGYDSYSIAVGLRYDEPRRVARLKNQDSAKLWYEFPLYDARIVLDDVTAFWQTQPFDLQLVNDPILGTYQGNCDFCFLKRQAKLDQLQREMPERMEWWAAQELYTGATFKRNGRTFLQMMDAPADAVGAVTEDNDLGDCLCTD